jgi:hypothetical protein
VVAGAQGPFEIVHLNTFAPTPKPVTCVVLFDGDVIVGVTGPDTHVQTPEAGNGAELLDRVALDIGSQKL